MRSKDAGKSFVLSVYAYAYVFHAGFQVFGPFTINSTTSADLKDLAFNATNCSSVYTTPIVCCLESKLLN